MSRQTKLFIAVFVVLVMIVGFFWLQGRPDDHHSVSSAEEAENSYEDLPETLSREDVGRALRRVKPLVVACGEGKSGVVRVHLTIAGKTGTVTDATVIKRFSGTDVARCATKIIELVQFPRFQKRELTVVYPYSFPGDADGGGDTEGIFEE